MSLALEYIIKFVILLVVAMVVIGLIYTFQADILSWWGGFMHKEPEKPQAEPIKGNFSNSNIARFIEGCWSINFGKQEDANCYFLMGNFSISEEGILSEIDESIIDIKKVILEFNEFSALVISYDNYRSEIGSEAIVVRG